VAEPSPHAVEASANTIASRVPDLRVSAMLR
jgi:hypothetical protein